MTKPDLWVGTSFKMNKVLAEGLAFAAALKAADGERDARVQRFVIPPFTAVREVKTALAGTSVKVGAQNMHWDDAGAWTGEVSPVMLTDCKLDIVELGHSERREHFGETDRTVGLKTAAAVRHGLIPLICIGETLAEREAGSADAVLRRQVEGALEWLEGEARVAEILLAYEPVWAIGVNGIPATAGYADERHAMIAEVAEGVLGRRIPVLYGGSVNPGNCEELIAMPHIDGLFIGRSAWAVEGYLDILSRVSKAI
ncbi:triose-phosphate isomerase [Rhizobium sp. TRM95111]|uniref:triose-phosphate isomerase n=1 Tax=Rhizobium alarense TaxID=2846851 RepID=UPI001F23FEFD|nr:triose-phosphate isomerase [Rhizobium alarense]MCF3639320.1 triose-phosphate isomerase [Rhizobium alarense]